MYIKSKFWVLSQTKLRVIAAKSKYVESVCLQKQNLKLFVCCFTSISCSCITISGNQINPHFSFLPLLKSALVDNIYWYNLRKKKTNQGKHFCTETQTGLWLGLDNESMRSPQIFTALLVITAASLLYLKIWSVSCFTGTTLF